MVSCCVSNYFAKKLKIKSFSKNDKLRILKIIFSYLLGLKNYSSTFKALKDFGIHITFSHALREMPNKFVDYIMNKFRRCANLLTKWVLPKCIFSLSKLDAKYLKLLSHHLDFSAIKKIRDVPTENNVVESYRKTILKMSHKIYKNLRNDNALAPEDIASELSFKLIEAYRLYIFNLGTANFNLKVFYSCLHKALHTKKIDFQGSTFKDKRIINNVLSCSIEDMEGVETENNLVYFGSPEDILIAKQSTTKFLATA